MAIIVNDRDILLQAVATRSVAYTFVAAQVTDLGALATKNTVAQTDLASAISAVGLVTALPAVSGYTGPQIIFNTTDGKVYRLVGGTWVSTLATTDLSGTIADAQLAAISASKISGLISDTQLAAISASKVAGQLSDSQLSAIAAAKITGQVGTSQIAAAAITASQIAANTIVAGNIAANAITTAAISAGAITASQIAANTITAGQIAANTITATQIAAGSITTASIAAGAITTATLAANAVTAANIAANTITASQIAAGAITATQIAVNTITTDRIIVNAVSNSVVGTRSNYTILNSTTDVIGLSMTNTGTGRVLVFITGWVSFTAGKNFTVSTILRLNDVAINTNSADGQSSSFSNGGFDFHITPISCLIDCLPPAGINNYTARFNPYYGPSNAVTSATDAVFYGRLTVVEIKV